MKLNMQRMYFAQHEPISPCPILSQDGDDD